MEKKYDFIDRLVSFAGNVILFVESIPKGKDGFYLFNQIMRSSGSAALNFAESQGASSDKDYLNKAAIALKELRETEVNFKIMAHVNYGDAQRRNELIKENIELIKILNTIIKNRRNRSKNLINDLEEPYNLI